MRHSKTRARLAAAAAFLALAGAATPARSQAWRPSDCDAAPLRLDAEVSCQKLAAIIGTGEIGPLRGETFSLSGRVGDYFVFVAYVPPPAQQASTMAGGWAVYSSRRSEEIIRALAGAQAASFGPYRGFDHTGYLEYRLGAHHCVGFDHGGGANQAGYEFLVRGFVCSRSPLASPEGVVAELLAALQLHRPNRSRPTNAFGGTPTALPWR